jgi:hypothetical protein
MEGSMSFALPERISVAGLDYAIIQIRRVLWGGVRQDYLVDHATRHIFISRGVPIDQRPAALAQARLEAELILLPTRNLPAVA